MPNDDNERTSEQKGYVLADQAMFIWNTIEDMIVAYNDEPPLDWGASKSHRALRAAPTALYVRSNI